MSVQKKIEKVFCTQILNLTNELIAMYPNVKDFKILKTELQTASSLMPSVVVTAFKTQSEQYLKQIESRDENFFLTMDVSGTPIQKFSHLKTVYSEASEKTKESIWKYVELLTKLSSKY